MSSSFHNRGRDLTLVAEAAVTATALSIFHNHDASAIILIWTLGTAALLVGLGGAFGRRMFSWVAPR
jgi:hypothetical protein